ncbi:MAG: TonB-dependent receptor plug domain-containing protein, partial [Pseudomonadota bacterium]|nr:TonB-dependent receptor plug domain-containing protein [Pseudomonadota bacterium]
MTNSTFRKSLTALAVAGSLAAPALAVAQDNSDVEAKNNIEKIQVTGSRIKRSDLESASPVEVISAEQLTDQGRLSVSEALRNLTSNSFGSFVPSSGSTAQSQSTVNLLGVGASRTLVLLDGKRVAGSPSLGGSSANLSTIPMAAVERIEVLKDGASAVYGSDAVAGVVNIILKDDFEGVAVNTQVGRPEAEGGDNESFSITAGTSSDRGNLTMVFEHQTRDAIYDRDRPYTAPQMNDENGDGLISIYDETIGISYYGATLVNPQGNYEASPLCGDLANNVEGFVGVLDQGTSFGGVGGGTVCGYAFAGVSTNMASTDRNSLMVNGNYQITDDIEMYMRGLFAKNSSFGRYAPAAAPWENIPASASHNPYDEELEV